MTWCNMNYHINGLHLFWDTLYYHAESEWTSGNDNEEILYILQNWKLHYHVHTHETSFFLVRDLTTLLWVQEAYFRHHQQNKQ